jgi:hypothetical protein
MSEQAVEKKVLKPRPGDREKYNARQREYMRKRRAAQKKVPA